VVIKDHLLDGPLAGLTLRVMDGVGNRRHGVALPQHYWSESTWRATWQSLGLTPQRVETRLDLYPLPLRWLFDRRLHFVALLSRADGGRADGLA
jgi:hypothetical protein